MQGLAQTGKDQDTAALLQESVRRAAAERTPLDIVGGGSKHWYGRAPHGETVHVAAHRGVVNYAPDELVLTARAGTPLAQIETLLAEHGQMLPFEPPHFGANATLGGTLACGFSGPRRPYAGSARDFVLGARIINGEGELLRFGGEVMKNVAGYDVSRLMVGSLGTLGIILEASLKVLPRPAREITLAQELDAAQAIETMNRLAGTPVPLSAACYDGNLLYLRLSGAASAVAAARSRVGGNEVTEGEAYWAKVREHTHGFFAGEGPLWRVSVAPAAPFAALPGRWFIDWGGAQRWYRGDAHADAVREIATRAGGHATLFRGGDRRGEVFHPLAEALGALQRRVKAALDPQGIFNPGRMYSHW